MSFQDYSLTPDDNTTLGDGTYIGPNMLRNKVRPALQQLAADGKALANDLQNIVDVATGPAGPAGNVAITLAVLKAAPTTNRTMIAAFSGGAPFNWETANAPYTADDVNIVQSDNAALSVGAWVRSDTALKSFPPAQGGTDDGVKTYDDVSHGSSFGGGTENSGPTNDEKAYWRDWIAQLGRNPTIEDQGLYVGRNGRFSLSPGNYGFPAGGHNGLVLGVAGFVSGAGCVSGSAVAAEFEGYISGSTLTVTSMHFGNIATGREIRKWNGQLSGVTVVSNGTGSGGVGIYNLSGAGASAVVSATTVSGSQNLSSVSGTLIVGQNIIGPGIPLDTTILSVGSGTAVMSANATASASSVNIGSVYKSGDRANAIADGLGYDSDAGGKNTQVVGQQGFGRGEHVRVWCRAGVGLGREVVVRGDNGNVGEGDNVQTAETGFSHVRGRDLRCTAPGASNYGSGVNPSSPSVNALQNSWGFGINVLQPTVYLIAGTMADSYTGGYGSRSGWQSLLDNGATLNFAAGRFKHVLENSVGPETSAVQTGLVAGVESDFSKVKANGDVFIRGTKLLGARGAAVADAVPAAGAPTQSEFNALVTQFNLLAARLRAATGHGLIA